MYVSSGKSIQEGKSHSYTVYALQTHPELCSQVRNIVLKASNHSSADFMQCRDDFIKTWHKPITSFSKFPRLSSVQFCLSPFPTGCWFCEEDHGDWNSQFQLMELLFGALCNRDRPIAHFRSLTIENHPDFYNPESESCSNFKQTLSRLSELHLAISSGWKRRDGLLHSFLEDLPSVWLRPSSGHLTHLTLYYDEYWGWDPAIDSRDIQFPQLIYLAVNNYTFAHDWQIEWISAHGSTLKTLLLDSCPILVCMVRPWYAPTVSHDDHEVFLCREFQVNGTLQDENHWTYNRRWHHFYAMLEAGLPVLTKFGCWNDKKGPEECFDVEELLFEARDTMLPRLPQDRYIVHDGPGNPWMDLSHDIVSTCRRYRVTSPAVAEPPYQVLSKAQRALWGERIRGDESDEDSSDENGSDEDGSDEDGSEDAGSYMSDFDFCTGCQKDDEKAFVSFVRAVTRRARAQGL